MGVSIVGMQQSHFPIQVWFEKMTRVSTYRLLAIACTTSVVGGCTTVVIHSEGKVTTEQHFGILKLDFANARATSVAIRNTGIVALPNALSIGSTDWQGVWIAPGSEEMCFFVHFAKPQQKE
jgi:hypothetical protein